MVFLVTAAVAGLLLWYFGSKFISRYNALIQINENVDQAWSNIDVMLKQRNDELTKLLDAVSEFQEHEEEIMREVNEARKECMNASGPKQEAEADAQLRQSLDRLFAVAENYPNLRSSENFQQLQKRISDIEERVADRRELYNESVAIFNARIYQIPDVVFASMLDYSEREMFEADEADRADVDIQEGLSSSAEPSPSA